jgi:5-methylcytosine-specific restriction endonuclease McrA
VSLKPNLAGVPQRYRAQVAADLVANEARWEREQAAIEQAERDAAAAKAEAPPQRSRRRRALEAEVPTEPYSRQEVFDRDRGRCYMCHRRLNPGWHIEHVIPISAGGPDTLENVRASCPRCNLRKGTQAPCYRT